MGTPLTWDDPSAQAIATQSYREQATRIVRAQIDSGRFEPESMYSIGKIAERRIIGDFAPLRESSRTTEIFARAGEWIGCLDHDGPRPGHLGRPQRDAADHGNVRHDLVFSSPQLPVTPSTPGAWSGLPSCSSGVR